MSEVAPYQCRCGGVFGVVATGDINQPPIKVADGECPACKDRLDYLARAEAQRQTKQTEHIDLALALDLLEKHQWGFRSLGGYTRCPTCLKRDNHGHLVDCALAQLLERHGREVKFAQ